MGYASRDPLAVVQVVIRPASRQMAALANRISGILHNGDKVLVVTADRTHEALAAGLQNAGLAPDSVHYIDTVSQIAVGAAPERKPNVTYIASPTMLEMVAMRAEQVARRIGGPVHVIIDSLNTLGLYNDHRPLMEFAHYLVNRLRTINASADLIVHSDAQGTKMAEALAPFTDGIDKMEAES